MDETTPPPRATPDDWIVRKGDAFMIDFVPVFCDDDEASEALALKNGERVPFGRLYTYPTATLTFGENGKWQCEPPAPNGAEQVMVEDDPETMSDSVAELVENADLDSDFSYTLHFYTWTDELWTFDAEAGKFTRGAA
ncbi:hypothetical protein GJ654_18615 [Rhodoblastus acidophilus]|uniref:Uncharacterized protein n=1 Tax=Rhodoblastus acidophilus TaxID=1074 RepID=A0A6N8DRG2_RHOAC|nr:hypothetical protein [Rhodoblastus acidophilus]MCW2276340.1 hypothetical protein [Rhodoblastus acidophilus]MTV32997.1 hypothetical protein [Rhodoblastus acidophilus]